MAEAFSNLNACARPRRHWPLSLVASILIVLVASGAIFCLRVLAAFYEKASRAAAAQSVVDQGAYISQWLARFPFFRDSPLAADKAEDFNRAVEWLKKSESGLQYVTISEDGVMLYRKQVPGGNGAGPDDAARTGKMTMGRKQLVNGTSSVPVITFSTVQVGPEGRQRTLEVALNKDAIERRSAVSVEALNRMYYISLSTIAIAFLACLAAVVGFVHREMVWQKRRRLDEHLAFAGAMAGSVIHDFRNPLSAMRLDAQLLKNEVARPEGARPERLAGLSQRIVGTIDRVDGLLAEFLTTARPEGGGSEKFELNAAAGDCIELLKTRFEKAGLRLAAELYPGPLAASGFPAQFKRALLNVMANAEQFSPPGGTVTIRTGLEGKSAFVRVTDEGPGVPTAERRKIFDLFYSKRPGGTGLGLSLARTAIKNCGGTIECQDRPGGKGTVFVIKIPTVLE